LAGRPSWLPPPCSQPAGGGRAVGPSMLGGPFSRRRRAAGPPLKHCQMENGKQVGSTLGPGLNRAVVGLAGCRGSKPVCGGGGIHDGGRQRRPTNMAKMETEQLGSGKKTGFRGSKGPWCMRWQAAGTDLVCGGRFQRWRAGHRGPLTSPKWDGTVWSALGIGDDVLGLWLIGPLRLWQAGWAGCRAVPVCGGAGFHAARAGKAPGPPITLAKMGW